MSIRAVERLLLIKAGSRSNIDLAADYRMYTARARLLIKFNRAVHNAVVGYCNAFLSAFFYGVKQRRNPAAAV